MKKYNYTINGNKYEIAINSIEDNIADITVNGESFKVEMEKEPEPVKKVVRPIIKPAAATKNDSDNILKAPLPGIIVEIKVKVGDEVTIGTPVVVLEAMKMANNLEVEKAGKITAIHVQEGETVMENTPLVTIE